VRKLFGFRKKLSPNKKGDVAIETFVFFVSGVYPELAEGWFIFYFASPPRWFVKINHRYWRGLYDPDGMTSNETGKNRIRH
jgi:hypothetical protein